MESQLWNARQVCQRLGISETTFHRWRKRGLLKRFETTAPLGYKRYSSAKVEEFLIGKSIVRIGKGARA